ncbi:PEP-CTERM sorting domain-containing protein [bacterium]|nr:PEP-CTERM sorting domain-containing protein [bacterium]
MKRHYIHILLATGLVASSGATTIGVKFLDSQDVAFGAAYAGAPGYAQENWNFTQTDWSGNAPNDAAFDSLITSTGATVTDFQDISYNGQADPIHFDSANTWRSGAGNGNANATLMNGYLDDGGNDQPYINLSLSSAVKSSTIVLYMNGDGPNGLVGRYWLEEWSDPLAGGTVITDQIAIASNGYSGTFTSAGTYAQTDTPVDADVASGNYIVFENITAGNIRIRGAGNGDPEDAGRGPINAFQIITTPVPEPSTPMTLVFAGIAVLVRRKR